MTHSQVRKLPVGFVDTLLQIVGPSGLITDAEAIEPFLTEPRGTYRGQTDVVVGIESRGFIFGGALAARHEITGNRDLVFPNRNDPRRPMSDGTVNSALRAMGYAGDEVTGSGFRATATGALLELGWRPEVIDRQLAHRERKEVFGAYSHQAEYLAERRKMMQQWADWLDQVKSGANVVPIRGHAA